MNLENRLTGTPPQLRCGRHQNWRITREKKANPNLGAFIPEERFNPRVLYNALLLGL